MAGLRWTKTITGQSSTFGLGSSLIYVPDIMQAPFAIGVGCVINSTGITFSVQHTFDYTGSSAFISSNATWFTNTGISSATGSVDGNYAFPVSAIRGNVTAGSSTGTLTVTLIQAGV
jgi:hypothetical protein